MELPYEPMKRTFKTRKGRSVYDGGGTGHTTGRNENKYYCKCTIEK
jgi:hypothetical protein